MVATKFSGSTSSLPSLGTGGSGSTSAAATMDSQSAVPAVSDPGIQNDSVVYSNVSLTSSGNNVDGSPRSGTDSVDDQVHISDSSYVKLVS